MKVIVGECTFNDVVRYYYTKTGQTDDIKKAKKFLFKWTAYRWLCKHYHEVENAFGFRNRQYILSMKQAKKLVEELTNN